MTFATRYQTGRKRSNSDRQALARQHWQDRPTTRSLLLTILGEYVYPAQRPVWTKTFIEALKALSFGEAAARQALARSARAGLIHQRRRGRLTEWSLTDETQEILAAGTQRIYSFGMERADWAGEWLLLQVTLPDSRRRLRHRLGTRLTWAGFGSLGQGLWISPDSSRESQAAEILEALDLVANATSFRGTLATIGDTDELVAQAWDLDAVAHVHQRFLKEACRASPATRRASFVALTRLVHRWRALPFVDPELPDGLLPRGWIGRRAARRFHQLHKKWSKAAQAWWQDQA